MSQNIYSEIEQLKSQIRNLKYRIYRTPLEKDRIQLFIQLIILYDKLDRKEAMASAKHIKGIEGNIG